MSEERIILKGELAELRMRKAEIAGRLNSKIKTIKRLLASFDIRELHEIKINEVVIIAKEASPLYEEYLNVLIKIANIGKELE